MTEKLSCHNCQAACCKGNPLLMMSLTKKEKRFMEKTGNKFYTVAKPEKFKRARVPYPISAEIDLATNTVKWNCDKENPFEPLEPNMGRYALIGSCKNLEKDENGLEYCGVYEDRPQVCRDFEVGSPKCKIMREIQGIPLPMAE